MFDDTANGTTEPPPNAVEVLEVLAAMNILTTGEELGDVKVTTTGARILGTPVGTDAFKTQYLKTILEEQRKCFEILYATPGVPPKSALDVGKEMQGKMSFLMGTVTPNIAKPIARDYDKIIVKHITDGYNNANEGACGTSNAVILDEFQKQLIFNSISASGMGVTSLEAEVMAGPYLVSVTAALANMTNQGRHQQRAAIEAHLLANTDKEAHPTSFNRSAPDITPDQERHSRPSKTRTQPRGSHAIWQTSCRTKANACNTG